jgi:hypothetical protein
LPLPLFCRRRPDMGELLDALNSADAGIAPEGPTDKSAAEKAAAIQSANRRISDAIETERQPGMPLDNLARLVRQAPLHSLAIAFLIGVAISRRG